jgi:hypothetical protein
MLSTARQTTALSLKGTHELTCCQQAVHGPATGGIPCVRRSSSERSRPLRTDSPPRHVSFEVHPDPAEGSAPVELLPTGDVIPEGWTGRDRIRDDQRMVSGRAATRRLRNASGLCRESTKSRRIVLKAPPGRDQRTMLPTDRVSMQSEPFGGTTGPAGVESSKVSCLFPAGCAGRKVAVGGIVVTEDGHGPDLHHTDTTRRLGFAHIMREPAIDHCMVGSSSGVQLHHAPLPRRSAAGQGFFTRVGAVQAGWCDVSSTHRLEPSDVPCDSMGHPIDKSFLADGREQELMHQEDGISTCSTKLSSFRGTIQASSECPESPWTSRTGSTFQTGVSSDALFVGHPDLGRESRPPDSAMLTGTVVTDQAGRDGTRPIRDAGFSDSFFNGRW